MKTKQKFSVISAFAALISPANGVVIYENLEIPIGFRSVGFDLNKDGVDDFSVQSSVVRGSEVGIPSTTRLVIDVNVNDPGDFALSALPKGATIGLLGDDGSTTDFTGIESTWALLSAFARLGGAPFGPFLETTAYVGISFEAVNGDEHFGYALLENDHPYRVTVLQIGYETEPGKSILAGAIPEPSSALLGIAGFGLLMFRRKRSWT